MNDINIKLLFLSLLTLILRKYVECLESENIIGGFMAQQGNFSYHVAVRFEGNYCGGAIISSIHVVTAAHCVFDPNGNYLPGPFEILAGVIDMKEHPPTRFLTQANKVYVPKQYPRVDRIPPKADIAILRVSTAFNVARTDYLSILEFPPPEMQDFTMNKSIITGFGINILRFQPYFDNQRRLIFEGYSSQKLHYAYVDVFSHEFCQSLLKGLPISQFCGAVVQNSNTPLMPDSTCRGDSGGPLVYEDKYLIGILVGGANSCNEIQYPAIYTSVIPFRKFFSLVFNDDCRKSVMNCHFYY